MSLEPMRILVIEDDPIDFSLVKKGFEGVDAPVELFHCPSADRVKEMLEARACKIVLLDLSLGPGIRGWMCCVPSGPTPGLRRFPSSCCLRHPTIAT